MKEIFLVVFFICLGVTRTYGANHQPSIPDWMPQPSDLAQVSDSRLLQTVEATQQAVAKSPRSATAWGQLGHVYLAHDWHGEATRCYRRAAKIQSDAFRWLYYIGRAAENNPVEAADVLSQAITLNSKYVPAHIHYANALRNLGRLEEAQRHFKRALELDPQNPFAELRLGQHALSAKRFETARDHLQRALTLNPEQSEVHAALAQVCLALGDGEVANQHARAARRRTKYNEMSDPLFAEVERAGVSKYWLTRRGRQSFMAKNFERAVDDLAEVVSEEEKNPLIWYLYGVSLLGTQQYKEAAAILERALAATLDNDYQNKEDMLKIYNSLVVAYTQVARPELAEQYLEKALDLNPSSIKAMNNLAFYYAENERNLDKALNLARKAVGVGPENGGHPMTLDTLGWVYFKRGNYRAAVKTFQVALQFIPNSAITQYHLGMAYLENRETQNALKSFQIALRLSPHFSEADETKAMIQEIERQ